MREYSKIYSPILGYQKDEASWSHIKRKYLHYAWPDVEEHIKRSISSSTIESLQIIKLDAKMRLIDSAIIAKGTIDHIHVKPRFIIERTLLPGVSSIILAHNHTSNDTTPSWDDISYTKTMSGHLHTLDIFLIDHLIVSESSVFSLRRNCLMF